jgi:hypothetical protein
MDSYPDTDTWQAEIAGRPSVFNHNPRLRSGEFRGFELVNEVAMAAPNGALEHVYVFARRGAAEGALLRVGICAHDDTRHALLALREALDHSMKPAIARASGAFGRIVDIGFASRGERGDVGDERGDGRDDKRGSKSARKGAAPALDAASFTVGNVVVTVQSAGMAVVDVSAAAAHLAKLLAVAPGKPALRSGRATSFAPAGVELRRDQALTLIDPLPEPRPGADRIQLLAPDGTFRREGTALVYIAGAGGAQRVALFTHAQAPD